MDMLEPRIRMPQLHYSATASLFLYQFGDFYFETYLCLVCFESSVWPTSHYLHEQDERCVSCPWLFILEQGTSVTKGSVIGASGLWKQGILWLSTVGGGRTMQTRRSSSALAVSGEVSLSFQDELAATIHRAFEVAVEIAVVEVSKLVSQALGDVRDQMQETLRENTFLKTRLQSAELELDTARRGRKSRSPATAQDEQEPKCESRATATADSPTAQKEEKLCRYDSGSEPQDESFCEIREDGSVRSRDLGSACIAMQKSGN